MPAPIADQVWYVAYGSNMNLDRLSYYLSGGRPPGGYLNYPGCRDPRPPAESRPLMIPGQVYFALESPAWTGGMAFYDPDGPGEVPARAYLVTSAQLSDIVSQEMCKEPGTDLDLSEALQRGRMALGPGCYETMICVGHLEGRPMLTFTAPWRSLEVIENKPVGVYLRIILTGLMEAHGWDAQRAATYLSGCWGAEGHWSAGDVAALLVRDEVTV